MPPNIDSLPAELVGKIVAELSLNDIKSLRETCVALCTLSTGPRFCSFLACQETDLTQQSLARLMAIASSKVFNKSVSTIKINALIYDSSQAQALLREPKRWVNEGSLGEPSYRVAALTKEELDEAETDLVWIESQQAAVKDKTSDKFYSLLSILRSFACISTVQIGCRVCQGRNKLNPPPSSCHWPTLFQAASRTFQALLAAILVSKVPVSDLNICFDTLRCSVPIVDITSDLEKLVSHWKDCDLSFIKKFSISICPHVSQEASDNHVPESSIRDFVRLLQLMTGLENLQVHVYKALNDAPSEYDQISPMMANTLQFPSLRACTIQNFRVHERTMLEWLTKHPKLQYLNLEQIRLMQGTWKPIFENISNLPELQKLKLSNLWGSQLMQLRIIGERDQQPRGRYFPCSDGNLTFSREFARHEFVDGFRFAHRPLRRPVGSPESSMWMENRRRHFGPW